MNRTFKQRFENITAHQEDCLLLADHIHMYI